MRAWVSCGSSSSIRNTSSAARAPSSRACPRSTSSSTAVRAAARCCARPRRWRTMNALQPENAALWYADKVRRFGFDHRGLGFRNRSSQEKRFDALMELGDLDGARLLDVGCGFGDFLVYLHQQGVKPVYTGLDICEPMIDRCRQLFGPSTGRFLVGDVLDFEPDETYDYVVASGLFGLDSLGARERIRPTMERVFGWARI